MQTKKRKLRLWVYLLCINYLTEFAGKFCGNFKRSDLLVVQIVVVLVRKFYGSYSGIIRKFNRSRIVSISSLVWLSFK